MQRSLPYLPFIALLCAPAWAEPVVVVPFFSQSPSANLDWIGESIAHTIQEALISRGLLVIDRDERETVYRRLFLRANVRLTHASVIKIADALDASDAVYGEFELIPGEGGQGTLRISAETLDLKRMRKGGQFAESGPLEDLAALQSRLAWQVLRELAPELTPAQEDFLRERPAVRLDAMENYTRGLLATNAEQKRRYLAQAARLDERFADPAFELGRLSFDQKEYAAALKWLVRIPPTSPRYFEATFRAGLCRFQLGEYAGAQTAFALVAASVPLNEVFNNLGAAQSRRNEAAALESFRKALDGDEADPDYHFNVGYALWKLGRFDEAAKSFRAAIDRNPEDAAATLMLGRCLKRAAARPSDSAAGMERVKLNYNESAYRQLKAALEDAKKRRDPR